jgi:ligand-binding sensor domain-containing protein
MRLTGTLRAGIFTGIPKMKSYTFYICLMSCTSLMGQSKVINMGNPYIDLQTITALDSNEKYVWIGTNKGIYRKNRKNGRHKFYTLSTTGYSNNFVTQILCQQDGCVWIGTNNGLIKYDNYSFISYSTENSELPENLVLAINSRKDGNILVSTRFHGKVIMRQNGKIVWLAPRNKKTREDLSATP